MRIVSWNCRRGFDEKAGAFLGLRPDIGIVPESCESPLIAQPGLFEAAVPHQWTGHYSQKGLGVFSPGADRLKRIDPEKSNIGDHGLACSVTRAGVTTGVVGVWTIPGAGSGDRYLTAARSIVDRYTAFLKSGTAVLAGDFNVSGRTALRELAEFARHLEERFGLVSAFHSHRGISIGTESVGTLWWRGSEQDAFHCDFVFVPKKWKLLHVEVGTYADWGAEHASARSDHAPVIVDVLPVF